MGSETTAAASGKVGVMRHDPMAMIPFCGYNMGDYFAHWLSMEKRMSNPPAIFHINWFRQGLDGKFLWPGFGENVRVLRWMLDRVRGVSKNARETEIGFVPTPSAVDLDGLDLAPETLNELLAVDRQTWSEEISTQRQFFETFGNRLPEEIRQEHENLACRLKV